MVKYKFIHDEVDLLEKICAGEIICLRTDTLYGLIADATNKNAVLRIFQLKNREKSKGIPVFFRGELHATNYAIFSENAKKIANLFWPGALTLILSRIMEGKEFTEKPEIYHMSTESTDMGDRNTLNMPNAPKVLNIHRKLNTDKTQRTSEQSGSPQWPRTIAVRVPNDPLLLKIMTNLNIPLTGTSANISNMHNVHSYEEFIQQLQYVRDINFTIYFGQKSEPNSNSVPIQNKMQSTIVAFDKCDKPIVFREGAISKAQIMEAISCDY